MALAPHSGHAWLGHEGEGQYSESRSPRPGATTRKLAESPRNFIPTEDRGPWHSGHFSGFIDSIPLVGIVLDPCVGHDTRPLATVAILSPL